MSGLFGSITIKGNRLTDLVGQTSTVGKPIPFGYGKCKITEPNVIWTAGIPKEHVKKKKQGKGGVKTEEYTYTLSYAIAVMAGPIYGYLTIKRGGKVVFTTDPNAPIEDKQYAAKWQQKAKMYLGTRTQMPDATIESYVGAGQVSAFRDLAYIVVEDDDVTGEGGAVPQYEFVVVASPPEVYLTSKPYIMETSENFSAYIPGISGNMRLMPYVTEFFSTTSPAIVGGSLRNILRRYDMPPEDRFTTSTPQITGGELSDVYNREDFRENFSTTAPVIASGTLLTLVIQYNVPPESFSTTTPVITGGTLS